MNTPMIAGSLDIAELSFWLFFLFFIGLVIYLRREDRREGYPLETDVGGVLLGHDGLLQRAPDKSFLLPFDQGVAVPDSTARDPLDIPNSQRTSAYSGSPIEPIGDGIGAGVGPGARARRADVADVTHENHLRIVPISTVPGISVASKDPDPRGMPMVGADGIEVGTISELWVDRAEMLIRYLEVSHPGGTSLVPMAMSLMDKRRGIVTCSALKASQFAGSPLPATPGKITRDEEEQIVAYFGSGYLYATPDRQEPYL